MFRLVGLRNSETDEHHFCPTNLSRVSHSAPDTAAQYRARWEAELLFEALKSRFGLDEIETIDQCTIEAPVSWQRDHCWRAV
jgi:IS4 transposase